MLPVAPGTIRGVWAKPAITYADKNKKLTVTESGAIIVGGEVRAATWADRPIPRNIKEENIDDVLTYAVNDDPRHQFGTNSGYFHVPYLTGAANQIIKDIAFIEMGRDENGAVPTSFFIADSLGPMFDVFQSNRMIDVTRKVMPGGFEFSHIISTN